MFNKRLGLAEWFGSVVFGGLFGAGVFVTTVVAGSVTLTKPFKVSRTNIVHSHM